MAGGILGWLLGSGNTAANTQPHQWGYDANGYLTPTPTNGPVPSGSPQAMAPQAAPNPSQSPVSPATPTGGPSPAISAPPPSKSSLANLPSSQIAAQPNDTQAAAAAPATYDPSAVTVTAQRPDNWKPKHTSFLGQLADYILGTHINEQTIRENMEGALQNLNTNPDQAIRRMAEFNPQAAMELYQKVNSEKHWNAAADRQSALTDLQGAKAFMPMVAGMVQHISTDANGQPIQNIDPNAWAAMKHQALTVAQHYHLSPDMVNDMIPDTPDPNVASALANGSFPVYRQAALANTVRHQGVMEGIGQQNAESNHVRAQAAMIGANNGTARVGIDQGNLSERINQDGIVDSQRQQALDKKPNQQTSVMTKYGPALIDPSGTTMHLKRGGKTYTYVKTGGQGGQVNWTPTGEVK